LQACGKVWRFAHDAALLRFARTNEIADHNQAGGDTYPYLHRLGRGEQSDGIDQRKTNPDRPLGVIFVRCRIAEINEHAVAHVLRDEAIKSGDRLGDAFVIGTDHCAQVLRVHAGGECRRTD
jgi:hypothetical protein